MVLNDESGTIGSPGRMSSFFHIPLNRLALKISGGAILGRLGCSGKNI